MASTDPPTTPGLLRGILRDEVRLLPLVAGVFRLDAKAYEAIDQEPHATPAAFAVVIGTAILWGIGQTSIPLLFLSIAGAILAWGLSASLVWAVGALYVPERADYVRLLRCLGFAFAWNVLQVGAGLPWIGGLFHWAALVLWFCSVTLATRQVLGISTGVAVAVCAIALAIPLLVLLAGLI